MRPSALRGILDEAIALDLDMTAAVCLQQAEYEREEAKLKAIAESNPFSGEAMVEMVT